MPEASIEKPNVLTLLEKSRQLHHSLCFNTKKLAVLIRWSQRSRENSGGRGAATRSLDFESIFEAARIAASTFIMPPRNKCSLWATAPAVAICVAGAKSPNFLGHVFEVGIHIEL